ncbi:MAG TPA: RNA polymerase sigma factor [Vicinamibacteria bacterium]
MTGSGSEDVLRVFEELYAAHGARLKSIACNLLGSRADAEDAVQEAFLKAFRSWDRFKGDAAPFTWLYRILVNACMDQGRRRQRRREDPEPESPEDIRPGAVADHPLRLALEGALRQLAPRPRAVFVLAEVEGFTHREIGGFLGIAEGTSKHDLFQAKNELRRLLRPKAAPGVGQAAS